MESVNIPRNKILCGDCMEGLKELPDGCVDLIMTDPPYLLDTGGSQGMTGLGPRKHFKEMYQGTFTEGITNDVLDELVRVMRKINLYIWCNERQMPQYLNYFIDEGCNFNVFDVAQVQPLSSLRERVSTRHRVLFILPRERSANPREF